MNESYVNRIFLLVGLLLSNYCMSAEMTKSSSEKKMQACVLYGTNQNRGYPISKQKCVDIRIDINCTEKVVDSESSSKIWRSYPMLDCGSPSIKKGLSERYILEGVD